MPDRRHSTSQGLLVCILPAVVQRPANDPRLRGVGPATRLRNTLAGKLVRGHARIIADLVGARTPRDRVAGCLPTADTKSLKTRLHRLLQSEWSDRWTKAANDSRSFPTPPQRTQAAVLRLLRDARQRGCLQQWSGNPRQANANKTIENGPPNRMTRRAVVFEKRRVPLC